MIGRLITFEGADAAGKSTQLAFLVALLIEKGYDVVQTREPGGTLVGEKLRVIILQEKMSPVSELLLFATMRAEHMATKILPSIAEGKIVVCDRFSDSSYAYQGVARGYVEKVLELEKFVLEGFEPHHTLFFDISLEESAKRLNRRSDSQDVFERELRDFKQKVYTGYQRRFTDHPNRMVRIDSMGTVEEVRSLVRSWVEEVFIPANPL